MVFNDEQYDQLIDLLSINPLMPMTTIAKHIKGVSAVDVANVLSEIRKDNNVTVTNDFIATKMKHLDPVWYLNGVMKSFLPDRLCKSSLLSATLESIAKQYESQEKLESQTFSQTKIKDNTRYSYIYRYFARLIDQRGEFPELNSTESAVMLSLLYEITNFKNTAMTLEKDFLKKITNKIQDKTAQFLLKIALPAKSWNEKNEKAFIEAFKIPIHESIKSEIGSKSYASPKEQHAALITAYNKKLTRFSLNPFSIDTSTKCKLKTLILSEILEKDNLNNRNLEAMCEAVGADPNTEVTIASDCSSNGKLMLVETSGAACSSKSVPEQSEPVNVEEEIRKRMVKHTLIDLDAYTSTLVSGIPNSRRRSINPTKPIEGSSKKRKKSF